MCYLFFLEEMLYFSNQILRKPHGGLFEWLAQKVLVGDVSVQTLLAHFVDDILQALYIFLQTRILAFGRFNLLKVLFKGMNSLVVMSLLFVGFRNFAFVIL